MKYPRLFGGTNDHTEFTAVALDGSGNLAVGGTSSDTSIVKNNRLPNPILVFYEPNGTIRWFKNFEDRKDVITAIAFSPDSSKLIFMTGTADSRTFLIVVTPSPSYT